MQSFDILFLNPVFHPGLNITCRRGAKWMVVEPNDGLSIKRTGSPEVMYDGRVVGKALVPFKLIPDAWLAYEHDPSCRDKQGLLQGMIEAYPDFTEDDTVTVLLFSI